MRLRQMVMEQGQESPGRLPLKAVSRPSSSSRASSGAAPHLSLPCPHAQSSQATASDAASHLIFPPTQPGLGSLCQVLCLSCHLCCRSALVPPACPQVPPGTHMLDGSLGFPVSTSGLKATEPLREGPAACLDVEAADWGVDAPATERLD